MRSSESARRKGCRVRGLSADRLIPGALQIGGHLLQFRGQERNIGVTPVFGIATAFSYKVGVD